jgi:thiol-disulfide isomerase/thioredoxin
MNKFFSGRTKINDLLKIFCLLTSLVFVHFFCPENAFAQRKTTQAKPPTTAKKVAPKAGAPEISNLPKVTQIDFPAFQSLLKREGETPKPLLINFWATWCDPCREEFPDLIKINSDYQGKIDFITVSLDELSEIDRDVPKFLAQMKATMPAYLLKTTDDDSAIETISKDWQGGLPFTILYNAKGETVFTKMGKVKPDILRAEIEKVTVVNNSNSVTSRQIENLPILKRTEYTYERGVEDARRDILSGKLFIKRYGLAPGVDSQGLKKIKEKYGVEILEHGCLVWEGFPEYVRGYNEVSMAEIRRKYGTRVLATIAGK